MAVAKYEWNSVKHKDEVVRVHDRLAMKVYGRMDV